jgi:hypothetical protein
VNRFESAMPSRVPEAAADMPGLVARACRIDNPTRSPSIALVAVTNPALTARVNEQFS